MLKLDVINAAYAWTLAEDGEVMGLTGGDHGWEPTGIFMSKEETDAYVYCHPMYTEAQTRITELEDQIKNHRD